jgi:hypothetical protein
MSWRVYIHDFEAVYVSSAVEVIGVEECRAVLADRFPGGLEASQARVVPDGHFRPCRCRLEVRMPVFAAERRTKKEAQVLASGYTDERLSPQVVRTGSPEEAALVAEGKRLREGK